MLGSAGTILADAFFVSDRLCADGLAAMNLAVCMFGLMNGTGLLFGIGGATRYTILKARGKQEGADSAFSLAFFGALTAGLAYALAGLLFSDKISYFLGADADTFAMCNSYLKTMMLFAPQLVRFFNSARDPVLRAMAESGMRLYFIGFLFVGRNYLAAAYFSATQQSRQAFGISVFRGLVGITAAACLLGSLWGMTGIWLSFPAVELAAAAVCKVMERRRRI